MALLTTAAPPRQQAMSQCLQQDRSVPSCGTLIVMKIKFMSLLQW